jgi:DNA-binding transcriptional regulator YiaG
MTGDELRRIRERLGLTQAQLADAIGHRVSIARWEAHTHRVPEPAARLIVVMCRDNTRRRRK